MKLSRLPFAILVVAAVAVQAHAANLVDPELLDATLTLRGNETVPVLVTLPEQFDTPGLLDELKDADFATRHHDIMVSLQDFSETSQAPYMGALRAAESDGDLKNVTPLWIVNAFEMGATRSGLERLETIFDDVVIELDQVELIEPVERDIPTSATAPAGAEWGLYQVKAPTLWAMGIKGQGTLVCNFDTGVDGSHEAFADRWRGLEPGVDWWSAWKSEDGSQFPSDCESHGTHTMGSMNGSTPSDTVGVAPAAKWIAARVGLSGCPGVSISSAFQWAGDPDGNPATTADVPDVVNNSWGSGTNCTQTYWTAIDNMEALGPVCTISAGNSGPGAQTVGAPANRATTHVSNFAVGATNENEGLAGFSSRGPTRCNVADSLKFKPEVSAPGSNVRSSIPGDRYASYSGTSMSCPHVSGAVALLRQILPALPAQDAKMLLYRTARHPSAPGTEDNNFGRGIIDLEAAANYLFAQFGLDGYLDGTVENNNGDPISGASVEIVEALLDRTVDGTGNFDFHLLAKTFTVVTSAFGYYPDTTMVMVPSGDTYTHNVTLRSLPTGTMAGRLSDLGDEGISATLHAYLEEPETLMATGSTDGDGNFDFDVMIGTYRVEIECAPPARFYSVEGVSIDSAAVSDLTATVEPADVLLVDADEGATNYESYFIDAITDAGRSYNHWDRAASGAATDAVGIMPTGSAIAWLSGDATAAIIDAPEEAALVSLLDSGGELFLSGQNIIESIDGGDLAAALGLAHDGNTAEHYIPNVESSSLGEMIDDIFTIGSEPPLNQNSQDILAISGNAEVAAQYNGTSDALVHLAMGSGSRAVVSGFGLEGVHGEFPGSTERGDLMAAVLDWLDGLVGIEGDDPGNLPGPSSSFHLGQNRPNPFNPSTVIRFTLSESGSAHMTVYDSRGTIVRTLVDERLSPGDHAVRWDGTTDAGSPAPSGVYFYRLQTKDHSEVRRMILVK